jgi:CheY-like chemotaxis protein
VADEQEQGQENAPAAAPSAALAVDARLALVCVDDPERQESMKATLAELGYTPEVPSSTDNALDRMRKSAYEVVIVDELFDGATPLDNGVLKGLSTMAMSVRRYMFVALIGKSVPTLDNATAFSRSVNAVFSYGDLDGLAPMLRRAIADNDAFYRVFREVLHAAGKR